MPIYTTTIAEDSPVDVEYEVKGKYLAPTKTSPAEQPDIKLIYVNDVQGNNILSALNDKTLAALRVDIQEHINEK